MCSDACDRTWAELEAQSGRGAVCPSRPPCVAGEGECSFDPDAAFTNGDRVEITGLIRSMEHNGKRGSVIILIAASGRYTVHLDSGERLQVHARNLLLLVPDTDDRTPFIVSFYRQWTRTRTIEADTVYIGSTAILWSLRMSIVHFTGDYILSRASAHGVLQTLGVATSSSDGATSNIMYTHAIILRYTVPVVAFQAVRFWAFGVGWYTGVNLEPALDIMIYASDYVCMGLESIVRLLDTTLAGGQGMATSILAVVIGCQSLRVPKWCSVPATQPMGDSDKKKVKLAEDTVEHVIDTAMQQLAEAKEGRKQDCETQLHQERSRDEERRTFEERIAVAQAKATKAEKDAAALRKREARLTSAGGLADLPRHWKIKAGSPPQQVDNTRYMRNRFEALMRDSILQGHEDGCAGRHDMSNLRVMRVERVENTVLWQEYHQHKITLRERLKHSGRVVGDVGAVCPLLDEANGRVLDVSLNEFRLWHGTTPQTAGILADAGFDERVASSAGLYGAGLYFADAACKSNQYATSTNAQGEHCMLQCRVLMGNQFDITTTHQNERRPPLNPATPGQPHDSIFAQTAIANGGTQQHNEFIVFRSNQVYPEFIIWYTL